MHKLNINLLGWNHKDQIGPVIESVLKQTFTDFELFYMDNASQDGSVDFVREHFPQVTIIANDRNLGYAGGHNKFFQMATSELVMVLNPDVQLTPEFLSCVVAAFDDPVVGAAGGKTLKSPGSPAIIDGTGIMIDKYRRGRDRGQGEEDRGQYDRVTHVFGCTGAAAIFRRRALEEAKLLVASNRYEYFDEDFFAYWEDMDLSWRLRLQGWECRFVPEALAYHPRKAASNPGGYKHFVSFVRHHRALPLRIRRWNWRNHLFCIIKNDFGAPLLRGLPFIALRELAILGYILIFEASTMGVVPEFFRLLPKMLEKRRYILSHKKITSEGAAKWFV